jgi:diguanylate cyclase (GGDEF)-like protein
VGANSGETVIDESWLELETDVPEITVDGHKPDTSYSFIVSADNENREGIPTGVRNFRTKKSQSIGVTTKTITKFTCSKPFKIRASAETDLVYESSDPEVAVVDPETNRYREFSATTDYEKGFAQAKEGTDFFETVREVAGRYNHPQDLDRFLAAFTKDNILSEIKRSGIFTWGYRLLMDGRPIHVQMKAAMVEEKEGLRLIVGLNDIDAQVRQGEELEKRLAAAQSQANIDALTGVKNKHAYLEAEAHMDRRIAEHRQSPFALVIFDVNNLKKVNDSKGHQAGDKYLRDACRIICDIFKHSPVYRVGGDEFAVTAQGRDYENIEELVKAVNDHNADALRSGGIVVACGMAKYGSDACVETVFERADHNMYENKNTLKSATIKRENSN